MQKIVKKLEELVGVCESRISKLEVEKQELANKRIAINKEKEDLDEREKNLDMREEQIKKSENIGRTLADADQILQQAIQKSNSLASQREKLEADMSLHQNNVADLKAESERQKEKIARQSAEIDKKAAEYKQEVLKELARNPIR